MTNKVAYNACYGGFCLSPEAVRRAKEIAGAGTAWDSVCERYGFIYNIQRHDPVLIAVIEELGESASGSCANLAIEEIGGNMYRIDEYDGNESVEVPNSIEWVCI